MIMIVRRVRWSSPLARRGARALQSRAEEPPRAFHFKCTQCGKCCTGKGGRVRVNGREREALQRELRVSADELTARYLTQDAQEETQEKSWVIKQTDDDAQCIFLEGTKCSVYKARPTQCRTFPWWPQNLISDYDWQLAARDCEGITSSSSDSGGAYSLRDVLPETIVYDIHRSGENYTYDELHEMLQDLQEVDPSFVDEYARELREKFHRRIIHRNAHVTVLDTFLDGAPPTRCFVFNDRLHLVQSEINLSADGETLDPSVLVLEVHRAMAKSLDWLTLHKLAGWKVALLGSGGGSLARYILHSYADNVDSIDAVEPNAQVNDIARRYFGMNSLSSLQLHQEFGEDFLSKQLDDVTNHGKYDLVFIDVEAGAPGDGILAPPKSMLSEKFLKSIKSLVSDVSIVAINVIAEDDEALRQVARSIEKAFGQNSDAAYVKLPKNTVIFLTESASSIEAFEGVLTNKSGGDQFSIHPLRSLLQ